MRHYSDDWPPRARRAWRSSGGGFGAEHPGYFEAEIDKGRRTTSRSSAYTSGTTGRPKGAMLTHANVVETRQHAHPGRGRPPGRRLLAYLPMAWVGDSLYTLRHEPVVGFTVNCPESPETVQRDLRELGPTAVLAPPRIWENMLTGVQVRAADAAAAQAPGVRALLRRRRAGGDAPRARASPSRSACAS